MSLDSVKDCSALPFVRRQARPAGTCMLVFGLFLMGCADGQSDFEVTRLESGDDGFGSNFVAQGGRMLVTAPPGDVDSPEGNRISIYEQSDSGWVEAQSVAGSRPGLGYGGGVDVFGERALVGGRILEYEAGRGWAEAASLDRPERTFDGDFGSAVALNGDQVFVAAPLTWVPETDGNPGVVFVYEPGGEGAWQLVDRLLASDPDHDDGFGSALDLSDGRLLVGASGDDGEYGEDSGAAYIFEGDAQGSWEEVAKLTSPGRESEFGHAVALEGDLALIGAPWASYGGRAYVFERTPTGGWEEIQILEPGEPEPALTPENARFGAAVALVGDFALIGAPTAGSGERSLDGAAYLFEREEAGRWAQIARYVPPDSVRDSGFGSVVTLTDSDILIGAPRAGAIFVYPR